MPTNEPDKAPTPASTFPKPDSKGPTITSGHETEHCTTV